MSEPRKGLFVRLPLELHETLTRLAEAQGVSLNLLIASLLAGSVGFRLEDK